MTQPELIDAQHVLAVAAFHIGSLMGCLHSHHGPEDCSDCQNHMNSAFAWIREMEDQLEKQT